jgi:hypothetical protein
MSIEKIDGMMLAEKYARIESEILLNGYPSYNSVCKSVYDEFMASKFEGSMEECQRIVNDFEKNILPKAAQERYRQGRSNMEASLHSVFDMFKNELKGICKHPFSKDAVFNRTFEHALKVVNEREEDMKYQNIVEYFFDYVDVYHHIIAAIDEDS